MKVLVTGGNGFLGSWMVRGLVEKGFSVRILHRPTSDLSALEGLPFESALGDVTDLKSVTAACQGMNAVFHIAGMISYSPSDFEAMEKVNVGGTDLVVQACLKTGVDRLVHTSSVVAIGATTKPQFLNEDSPYQLDSYHFGYYETKRKAEGVITKAVAEKKLNAVIVNPSIMFGPGDATKSSRKVHLKVAEGRFPIYPGGGCNIMHVADAIEGHLLALEKGKTGQRYILGGENVLIRDLFKMLAEAGGHEAPPLRVPNILLRATFRGAQALQNLGVKHIPQTDSAMISTLYHWYDTSKARKELDLRCRPGHLAIKESVLWAKENGYLKD